jgi:hypothetical protein
VNVKRTLYWFLPPLLCLVLYWPGLKAWFQMDDFAWLSIHRQVYDLDSFLRAMFVPMAQGTVRPLSERLFFLSFWHMFGMEALPYRIFVFATQFANLALIAAITRRLTGSTAAGFFAPILWLLCPVLYTAMVWTSAYNQVLAAFFFLVGFYSLLSWVETGRKRWYAGIWAAFLLGFGALEINVVFPAVAASYLFLFARRRLVPILPMFAVSAAFTIWHRSSAKGMGSSVYAMNFDPTALLRTFGTYALLAVSTPVMGAVGPLTEQTYELIGYVVLTVLGAFIVRRMLRREWLALFLVAWFAIIVGPYVPLTNHISDYYLTVPTIGLAMLGAWAMVHAWRGPVYTKALAILTILLFAIPCIWQEVYLTRWTADRSRKARTLVRSLAAAHRRFPDKVILLHGVDEDLFWTALYDRPELALGWTDVYMTAPTESVIKPLPGREIVSRFMPDAVAREAIKGGKAVVYDVTTQPIRNITHHYAGVLESQGETTTPALIQAGNPHYARFLKDGWHEADNGTRWSGKRAVLEIAAPKRAGAKLKIDGWVSDLHTAEMLLKVAVFVNGRPIGVKEVPKGVVTVSLEYDLPAPVLGSSTMDVAIELDRTVSTTADTRKLGLSLGTIGVVEGVP